MEVSRQSLCLQRGGVEDQYESPLSIAVSDYSGLAVTVE